MKHESGMKRSIIENVFLFFRIDQYDELLHMSIPLLLGGKIASSFSPFFSNYIYYLTTSL